MCERLVAPHELDVGDPAGDVDEVDRSLADDLVGGDVDVAAPRVVRLRAVPCSVSLADVHDAEAVAFRVGQDDVVRVGRPLVPVHVGRAQVLQPLDLAGLVLV